MKLDLEGRHVVVTGGTGALGETVVRVLLEAGAKCHLPVRDAASLDRFEWSRHAGVEAASGVDLGDEDAVRSFFESVPSLWASVHCAGGFAMSEFVETSAADFVDMMKINVRTCFLCCREAVRRMRAAGEGGRIVNVAARPALEPRSGAGMVGYAASKAAVAAITTALAEEVADEGIWVNAIAPSILDTEANRRAMPEADRDRWVKLEDAAAVIAFLVSPGSNAARGGIVPVYGRS